MRLGIDASNLRDGGGITHLLGILGAVQPHKFGITRVTIWAGRETLKQLPEAVWLERAHDPLLDQTLPARIWWQKTRLPQLARQHCDVLFAPGGICGKGFHPVITMSRNLLPFELRELFRYGVSILTAKFLLLRATQSASYRQADGVIFLSDYARTKVGRAVRLRGQQLVIPHGINSRFFRRPREQKPIQNYSTRNPFRLLYVSKIEPYKHQWRIVEAIAQLRSEGLPVTLELIGSPARLDALRRLFATIKRVDAAGKFVHYYGHIPYTLLADAYHRADGFVFGSSCENLPNILLEAMAAGLPIASSDHGPMLELLGEAGLYFDPEQPQSVVTTVRQLMTDHVWRTQSAHLAYERAQAYSWERCADETFSFLTQVAAHALSEANRRPSELSEFSGFSERAK